mmetsp:Transcript_2500/g.3459  ORF Transcript_2500/g.3459 Transcript_2500/m.3459 type:complete len:138 (+) Transcript_2500:359-772(+)
MIALSICLVSKHLEVARWVNPVLLTLALMMHQPILPVYHLSYGIFSLASQLAFGYVVSFIMGETIIGALVSFSLIFNVIGVVIHRVVFDWTLSDWRTYFGFYFIGLAVSYQLQSNQTFNLKMLLGKRQAVRRQRDEF